MPDSPASQEAVFVAVHEFNLFSHGRHFCMNIFILISAEFVAGNHEIFYIYIRTERVRTFFIISLILNEFSYGEAQIPHRFL